MFLEYQIIEQVITNVIQNPNITLGECVDFLVNNYGFTEFRATFWMNLFLNAICNNFGTNTSLDEAKLWLNKMVSNGVTIEQICDVLIAMMSVIWKEDEEITVIRNNQLYSVDLSQPPTGICSVHFSNISVNVIGDIRKAIITIDKWSYSLSWDKVPDRFKQLYVVWLQLQNISIPVDLQSYITNTIDISNLYFDINLDEAVLLSEI